MPALATGRMRETQPAAYAQKLERDAASPEVRRALDDILRVPGKPVARSNISWPVSNLRTTAERFHSACLHGNMMTAVVAFQSAHSHLRCMMCPTVLCRSSRNAFQIFSASWILPRLSSRSACATLSRSLPGITLIACPGPSRIASATGPCSSLAWFWTWLIRHVSPRSRSPCHAVRTGAQCLLSSGQEDNQRSRAPLYRSDRAHPDSFDKTNKPHSRTQDNVTKQALIGGRADIAIGVGYPGCAQEQGSTTGYGEQ